MKTILAVAAGLVALTTVADAGVLSARNEARMECMAQARAMGYVPHTVKWSNAVKDCMIDRDFNSG